MSTTTRTKKTTAPTADDTSKKDKAIGLLRRDSGASIDEIVSATGWLPHSTRAVFTGLRKKGFGIEKQKIDGSNRYRITAEPAA